MLNPHWLGRFVMAGSLFAITAMAPAPTAMHHFYPDCLSSKAPTAGVPAMDITQATLVDTSSTAHTWRVETAGDIQAYFNTNPPNASFALRAQGQGHKWEFGFQLKAHQTTTYAYIDGLPITDAAVSVVNSGADITFDIAGVTLPPGVRWGAITFHEPHPGEVLCDPLGLGTTFDAPQEELVVGATISSNPTPPATPSTTPTAVTTPSTSPQPNGISLWVWLGGGVVVPVAVVLGIVVVRRKKYPCAELKKQCREAQKVVHRSEERLAEVEEELSALRARIKGIHEKGGTEAIRELQEEYEDIEKAERRASEALTRARENADTVCRRAGECEEAGRS